MVINIRNFAIVNKKNHSEISAASIPHSYAIERCNRTPPMIPWNMRDESFHCDRRSGWQEGRGEGMGINVSVGAQPTKSGKI